MNNLNSCLMAVLLLVRSSFVFAQTFTKITSGEIVNDGGSSEGCAWGDYDNDGDLDLVVANSFNGNFLYENNGNGTFTKITAGAIVADRAASEGCTWGDYDNDGDLDLFIANSQNGNNFLYRNNGDRSFTKITTGAIVSDGGNSFGASWGDYDNDGHLDLFVANSATGENNFLYRNNGDGGFTRIRDGAIVNEVGFSFGCSWADYDNDGDLDLFVANWGYNFLYRNDGPAGFFKVPNGPIVEDGGNSVGGSWGDFDNDGDLDLFVTNTTNGPFPGNNDFLYENNGDGSFTKITSGSIVNDGARSEGSSWGDYDNDGDLDLYVANEGPKFLYRNDGNRIFTRITTGAIAIDTGISRGTCWADYNNDGALDLFVSNNGINNLLYQNDGNSKSWINISLVGTVSNASAIGARVSVKAAINGAPVWQIHEISAQTGAYSQNSLNAEFGLGDAAIIDSIKVAWPSGILQHLTGMPAKQFLTITEPQFARVTGDVVVDDRGNSYGSAWGDYDNDGDLDLFVANIGDDFLYRNNGNGGFVKVTAGPMVNDGARSFGASWGDYDNDHDLDLFVANDGNDFLYRNDGPAGFAKIDTGAMVNDGKLSNGCSWGDYDNDGHLDLFVANIGGNFLYHNNRDGTFSKVTTGAIVTDGGRSVGCAWGDYDNDGDLDLFVANAGGENNFLYRNLGGGEFGKAPAGAIVSDGGNSFGGSWGDFDNDGDLDLFVANEGNNFLYRNNGDGSFTPLTTGAIVRDGGQSLGSSWGDYDNDGDLDLFVANLGDDFLYRNDFDPDRPGQVNFSKVTTDLVVKSGGRSFGSSWADFDNDGDLDLFVANILGENSFLYQNLYRTSSGGNHWINLRLIGTVSNASAIGAKVRIKARIKDAPVWQLREISGQTGYLGQSSLNAEFGLREAARIDSMRLEWPSGTVNTYANVEANQFLTLRENNRPRPAAGISDVVLSTASPSFVRDLSVDPAVFFDPDNDTLNYATASSNQGVANSSVSGSLLTVSLVSDTATGKATISVTADDGRGESAGTTFEINRPPFILKPISDLPLPLGALKRVNLQEVFVDPERDALTFTQSNSNDSVVFALISEATLFLFPENSGSAVVTVHANDGKGGAGSIQSNLNVVTSPHPEIQHDNIALADVGREIAIAAEIFDDEGAISFVFLNYRNAGDFNFVTVRMDTLRTGERALHAAALIPANAVTERGVEYFIEAADIHNVTSRQPERGVFSVRVRVEGEGVRNDTPQPFGTEQTGYHLISIPLELDRPSPAQVLVDDLETYDQTQWRFYAWEPLENGGVTKVEFPNTPEMSLGAAFWLIIKSAGKFIDTGPGTTCSTAEKFPIPLRTGWNLVGNPFNFPSVAEDTLSDGSPLLMFSYNNGVWSALLNPNTTQLQPFEGYAVRCRSASTMWIKPNPFDTGTAITKQAVRNDFETLWSIRILAQCQQAKDENNIAAIARGTSRSWDRLDHPEPPGIGEYVSVCFPHPDWTAPKGQGLGRNYSTDFRPEPLRGDEWEVEIQTNIRDVVNLTFTGVDSLPADHEAWLVDKALKITNNLQQRNAYAVAGQGENHPKRLTLIVGKRGYMEEKLADLQLMPTTYELSQNFPNPFNPATTVHYGLPKPDRVTLRVYDILGNEVVTLVDHELKNAGYHVAIWNGRNAAGNIVSSGVYFIRMQATNFMRMRKMLLIE